MLLNIPTILEPIKEGQLFTICCNPHCTKITIPHTCKKCHGTGKIEINITIPRQWTPEELRRNPFLTGCSPPKINKTTYMKCSHCHGSGISKYCNECERKLSLGTIKHF